MVSLSVSRIQPSIIPKCVLHPSSYTLPTGGGGVDRGGRAIGIVPTRGTIWRVATFSRLERNVPRPKYHRQRKPVQRKGRRRHNRYQARGRILTVSASSFGQGQGLWRQRWRLVCVCDLAGSTSSPNQHWWHQRQRQIRHTFAA